MHSICVWNMVKQSKSLQTRFDRTYINYRYYIRTNLYAFLFLWEKTRVWIIASLTLKMTSWGYPIHGIYRLNLHYTIKTCLKRVGHCGFELVGKEMCRFAEDMSKQTHCMPPRISLSFIIVLALKLPNIISPCIYSVFANSCPQQTDTCSFFIVSC